MKFSDELLVFLGRLHQDFFMEKDAMKGFTEILASMGRKRSAKLAEHLDVLLSQPYDLADLERQWTKSGAEFYISKVEQIPDFLGMVRDLARSDAVRLSPRP